MRREVAGVLCLLLAGTAYGQPPTAGSPAELEQRSKAHFKLGLGHLELHEYDAAIKEFETGYEYKPLPLFLYNIAQVAALAGHRLMAVEYYEKYLDANPRAVERVEVQQRIRDLQRSLAERPEAPPEAAPPPPATAAPPVVVTAPPPEVTPAPAVALVEAAPPPKPSSRKKTAIALGIVGGVLLIGAVVAIGVTQASHDGSSLANWGSVPVSGQH